jgi:hypothetical protein
MSEKRIAHVVFAIRPDSTLWYDAFVYADPDDAHWKLAKEREKRGFQAAWMRTMQLARHEIADMKQEPSISDTKWDEFLSPGLELVWRAQA